MLNDYSSFLFNALGSIGQDLAARNKKQDDEAGYKALTNSAYAPRQPQPGPSAIGQAGQPQDLIPQSYYGNAKQAESGGNLNATNPNSTSTGPYQFTQGTWLDLAKNNPNLGLTPEGRTDPAQNERAIRALTQQNAKTLYSQGVPVNPGTLYTAHFLGAGDAIKVLSADDSAPLSGILSGQVIKANPSLQGMTAGQFKEMAAKKGGNPKGGYQVASNDPGFVPSGDAQNPVDQAFASLPQQPQQASPMQAPQTVTNTVPAGAQTSAMPQQTAQAAPQQAAPQQPQLFTPQSNQSILPPREDMLAMLRSEAARPYALELMKANLKGYNPGFKLFKDGEGNTWVQDLSTGEPKIVDKASDKHKIEKITNPDGSETAVTWDDQQKQYVPVNFPQQQTNDASKGLTGDEYLATVDPTIAAQVKAMDQGDLNFPTGFAAKAPYWQQRLNVLYHYNPKASQQTAAAVKAFNTGKQGDVTRFINAASSHLNLFDQLIPALKNRDTQAINRISNAWNEQFGSPAPTNFDFAKQIISDEVLKAVIGSGAGTGQDRDNLQRQLSTANSPDQLQEVVNTAKGLMRGQSQALEQQYKASTQREDYRKKYLTPEAANALYPQQVKKTGTPAQIKGDDDYKLLPSGAIFIAPDGSQRRKP